MGRSVPPIVVITAILALIPTSGVGQEPGGVVAERKESVAESASVGTPSSADSSVLIPAREGLQNRGQWSDLVTNPVVLLMAFMLVFYLLLVLPQQRSTKKSQREHAERLASLKKNDRVVTAFGVHGIVANINSEAGTVTLRIDEGTNAKMTIERDTIRVVKKD